MTMPNLRREPVTLVEMTIKGLMVDPITNMPIVLLKDKQGDRVLPIWVGIFEANAIALQIENVATPRPMTHDLLRNVIRDLNAAVERIVVCDLKENTFYATIYLTVGGETVAVVSHGGAMTLALPVICGQSARALSAHPLANAAVVELEGDADGWRLLGWPGQAS